MDSQEKEPEANPARRDTGPRSVPQVPERELSLRSADPVEPPPSPLKG